MSVGADPPELRAARAGDAARLSEIAVAAYGVYVEELGGRPRPMLDDYDALIAERDVVVAERGGDIVGLMVLGPAEEGFLLDNLAADPAVQGSGVGRALLIEAEHRARAAGHDSIYLYTHELMRANLALYERIGYEEYGRRPIGDSGHLVYMRKPLD